MSLYADYSLEQLVDKVAQTPDDIDLHIALIKQYVISDKLEAAIHQANLTDELMPGDRVVNTLKAFCLNNLGHMNEGVALIEQIIRQNATAEYLDIFQNEIAPLFHENLAGMTHEEFVQRKIEDATDEQKRHYLRAQSFIPIHHCMVTGQYERVVELLNEHLAEFPEDLNAQMGLAGAYEQLGQNQQAESLYCKVIHADPQSASAYFGLAYVTSDLQKAIEASTLGLELSPAMHTERYNLGVRLLHSGEGDLAEHEWLRIPADDSIYPYALSGIGEYYQAEGDLAQAIEYQQKAVTLTSQNPEMHAKLGMLRIEAGDNNKALESLEAAAALDPASTLILEYRVKALRNLGQTLAAIDLLEDALEESPDDFGLNFRMGLLRYDQDDFESCIEHCLRAIELNCEDYASYWNAAISFARLDQRDECLEYLTSAVERNPEMAKKILEDDDLQPYRDDPQFVALAKSN